MSKLEGLANWNGSNLYTDDERVALEYAESVTLPTLGVSDDLRRRLKDRFTDDALIELTGLIAFQNMSAKFNSALDIPAQGLCVVPPRPAV